MSHIISRKEAKALGLLRYFTGKPCLRGHLAERLVSTRSCVACSRERKDTTDYKAYRKTNSERRKAYNKAHYEANADRYKACQKAYREANSERRKAYKKARYEANPERQKAAWRAWREAHHEQCSASNKAWREANPDKVRARNRNHRALKRSAEGSHTAQDIQDIYAAQQGLCAYCRVDVGTDYHVDHIQPLSRGGSNGKENLQITCPTCNLRKHTKTHKEFLAELELDNT